MAVDERVQLELTTPTIITIIPKMYLVAPAVGVAVRPCVHDGMTFNLGMATHLPGDSICSSSRACDTHRQSEATLSNASYRHHPVGYSQAWRSSLLSMYQITTVLTQAARSRRNAMSLYDTVPTKVQHSS